MDAGKTANKIWPKAGDEGIVEETTEHTIHSKKYAKTAKDIVDNIQKGGN